MARARRGTQRWLAEENSRYPGFRRARASQALMTMRNRQNRTGHQEHNQPPRVCSQVFGGPCLAPGPYPVLLTAPTAAAASTILMACHSGIKLARAGQPRRGRAARRFAGSGNDSFTHCQQAFGDARINLPGE